MTYITGDIPVGAYEPQRLANLGIGHAAIDGGAGYTYFNPQTGHELSAVGGLTYNFKNPDTDYRNGVDFHLDMGASQFLSKQVMVGLVGYAYQQLTGDSGGRVGDFKSRVFGVGPQVGFIFPLGTSHQGYVNLKGYKEFGAEHRPEGWNAWLTFVISPAAQAAPTSAMRHMVSK
ncbi:MAG: transporter [Xanthobacteraceae bacterium]